MRRALAVGIVAAGGAMFGYWGYRLGQRNPVAAAPATRPPSGVGGALATGGKAVAQSAVEDALASLLFV